MLYILTRRAELKLSALKNTLSELSISKVQFTSKSRLHFLSADSFSSVLLVVSSKGEGEGGEHTKS